jgi:hypothetical protein
MTFLLLMLAVDPAHSAWILSPPGYAGASPNVHSVEVREQSVVVRSSGLSLKYLGLLQAPPVPQSAVREFAFEIPRHPSPAAIHRRIPVDVAGVFVNGMPIYNQCETLSFNGANLWHYDAVAANDDGTLTAAGHPHPELTHRAVPGLLDEIDANVLIGFALDGYPIYGKRMRSSYRLRAITRREILPDGTRLTPEQYGPAVDVSNPLGTFAEDYEYVAGSGDLDQFNGKPIDGGYAYFLAVDVSGRLAYPYMIGPRYYGAVPGAAEASFFPVGTRGNLQLSASAAKFKAGEEVRFRLDAGGIRHFEFVHERPIHFLVISADLGDFDHIHPQLASGDRYEVTYTFPRGGAYRLWADFSLPGEAPRVESWDVIVDGPKGPQPAHQDPVLRADLISREPLRTGRDIPITLKLHGADEKLEPYLGAWAHVIIVSDDLSSFIHAHPLDGAPSAVHSHVLGPTPSEIHIVTSFPRPGKYKLWAQFQRSGQVVTLPFLLDVAQGSPAAEQVKIPDGAVRIRVTQHGYEPSRIEIPANRPLILAVSRDDSPNCGADILFPTLGIRRPLGLGETVLIDLPAQAAGELAFSCGMGMFRGMLIVK